MNLSLEERKLKKAELEKSTKFFSLAMLGVGGLMGLMAFASFPSKAQAAIVDGKCYGYGSTIDLAKEKLKLKCNVNFKASRGDFCQKTATGRFRCTEALKTEPVKKPAEKDKKPAVVDKKPVVVDKTPVVVDKTQDKVVAPPGMSKVCKTLWAPEERALAAMNWSTGGRYTGGKDRISFDSKTGSLRIEQPAKDHQLSDHRGRVVDGGERVSAKGDVGRMRVQMFLSKGFTANSGSRLAIGIRGGPTRDSSAGGGVNKDTQQGWSLRVNYGADLRPMMYGYHLNRRANFGSGPRLSKPLPTGEWITMVIEVKLNTPGKQDGTAFMKIYDKNGKLYDEAAMSNIEWRRNASWDNFGVYLTDKYEVGPSSTQFILYRNYNMSVGSGKGC